MELVSTHAVRKSDLGFHGNLFGGNLLKWVDLAALAYATQSCDTPRMVTVTMNANFKRPTKEGQLIKIYASILDIGNKSITLKVEARSHDVYDGEQIVVLEAVTKFVRVNEENKPIPISDRVKLKFGFKQLDDIVVPTNNKKKEVNLN
jgi:acyl-CoA thioesterase YciA